MKTYKHRTKDEFVQAEVGEETTLFHYPEGAEKTITTKAFNEAYVEVDGEGELPVATTEPDEKKSLGEDGSDISSGKKKSSDQAAAETKSETEEEKIVDGDAIAIAKHREDFPETLN